MFDLNDCKKQMLETVQAHENELKNIINSQQKVIDKMSNKLKQQEKELMKFTLSSNLRVSLKSFSVSPG